jgi:hypothetical protein
LVFGAAAPVEPSVVNLFLNAVAKFSVYLRNASRAFGFTVVREKSHCPRLPGSVVFVALVPTANVSPLWMKATV